MGLSFKLLAAFSLSPPKSSLISSSANEGIIPPSVPPIDLATLQFDDEESSISQQWPCQCGSGQTDFCPYCEYDRTNRMLEFTAMKSPTTSGEVGSSGSSRACFSSPESYSQPRKLRKVRSDYKQLKYEAMSVEAVVSNPPDFLLSKYSRAPISSVELPSTPTHLPLPPFQRMPRKLEKKNKKYRATSTPNSPASSSFNSSSDAEPRIRIVKSKSFLDVSSNSKIETYFSFHPCSRKTAMRTVHVQDQSLAALIQMLLFH